MRVIAYGRREAGGSPSTGINPVVQTPRSKFVYGSEGSAVRGVLLAVEIRA